MVILVKKVFLSNKFFLLKQMAEFIEIKTKDLKVRIEIPKTIENI